MLDIYLPHHPTLYPLVAAPILSAVSLYDIVHVYYNYSLKCQPPHTINTQFKFIYKSQTHYYRAEYLHDTYLLYPIQNTPNVYNKIQGYHNILDSDNYLI